jgi:hypothetical protein
MPKTIKEEFARNNALEVEEEEDFEGTCWEP